MRKLTIVIALEIVFILGCIEPYEPHIADYENLLVIDAMITNQEGPYTIRLNRSYSYDGNHSQNVRNAVITVRDNHDNEYNFREIYGGLYQNSDSSFRGKIGYSYMIHIETETGEIYESDFEELKEPIPIDSIYYQYEPVQETSLKGIQIYLNTHDPENETWYYAWTYKETWEFAAPLVSYKYPQTCFRDNSSLEFIIGSSIKNNKDELKRQPVYYVDYNSDRLRIKYSTLLQQYSLTEENYLYLSELKRINESGGTLYDAPPTSLSGNVFNINNPKEAVLGLFQVSGVSEKRLFIDNESLPDKGVIPKMPQDCDVIYILASDTIAIAEEISNGYFIAGYLGDGESAQVELINQYRCIDCRESGTAVKPDFWED